MTQGRKGAVRWCYSRAKPHMRCKLYRCRRCFLNDTKYFLSLHARRRMEREAKAKVVASVWGAKFVPFLAALSFCLGHSEE